MQAVQWASGYLVSELGMSYIRQSGMEIMSGFTMPVFQPKKMEPSSKGPCKLRFHWSTFVLSITPWISLTLSMQLSGQLLLFPSLAANA